MTPDWASVPIVFVVRPACPSCGCEDRDRRRTYSGGDGSKSKRMICRQCRQPWLLVEEPPPDSGKMDADTL